LIGSDLRHINTQLLKMSFIHRVILLIKRISFALKNVPRNHSAS
jgi:hypothetical protein